MDQPTAATAKRVLARLAPWLPTLQQLDPPIHDAFDEALAPQRRDDGGGPHVLWVVGFRLFCRGAEPEPLDKVCEALGLLALLARVDLSLWKALLRGIWPASDDLEEWFQQPLREPPVMGLDLMELYPNTYEGIKRFGDHAASKAPPSREYLEAYEFIRTLAPPREDQEDASESIRVRLELECIGTPPKVATAMLQLALKLVKDQAAKQRNQRATNSTSQRPRFRMVYVDFLSAVGVVINLQGMRCLLELMRMGVPLSHLPVVKLEPGVRNSPAFVQALREMMGLDGDPNLRKWGPQSMSINDEHSGHVLNGLLSAAQHSSTVETLEIEIGNGDDPDFPDQNDIWAAVALAIFCPGVQHSIQRLKLNATMLQDVEVDAVRETLEAVKRNAATNIQFGSDHETLQVVASRFKLVHPEFEREVVCQSKTPITVDVFDTPDGIDFPWYQVELPGHGDAWVHTTDVISTSGNTINPLERLRTPAPGFPRIDITHMTDDSMDHVAGLLELIGHGTEHIAFLEHMGERSLDDWCQRVLVACPKLEKLLLRSTFVENLGLFCTAALEGRCRLRQLYVCTPTRSDAAHVQAFFDALSSPTHPLTDHLRELYLRVAVENEDPQLLIAPVLRMLQANRRLLELTLVIERSASQASSEADYRAAFDTEEKQRVSIRTGPLELCRKFAFFNCVNHASTGHESLAVRQLDASLVAIIFQFAAHGRARKFTVRYNEFHGFV